MRKAMIDKDGFLSIERRGKMKTQLCPFFTNNTIFDGKPCGDWCPLFGEPYTETTSSVFLRICQKTLVFDVFSGECNMRTDKTSSETSEIEPTVNANEKVKKLHTKDKSVAPVENFKIVEKPKKKRGRPRKVVEVSQLTVRDETKAHSPEPAEIAKPIAESESVVKITAQESPVYHEPCKTCRKSRKDSKGNYPMCKDGYFEHATTSGIEICPLWWER